MYVQHSLNRFKFDDTRLNIEILLKSEEDDKREFYGFRRNYVPNFSRFS